MEIKLTKEYKRLADIALSASAPILQYVHIKDGIAEVSDGFMLVQKPIDYQGDELLLDAEAIKKQKTYPMHCNVENANWIVIDKDQSYPDTEHLYPQSGVKSTITVRKSKLYKFLKCFDDGDDIVVEISIYGDSKPVELKVIKFDGTSYGRGLIMPITKINGGVNNDRQ